MLPAGGADGRRHAAARAARPRTGVRAPTPTNGLAVASLLCGLLWLGWLGSALAIVFGHVALAQVARAGGRQAGRGIAIAGLALGYLGALTFALTAVFFLGGAG